MSENSGEVKNEVSVETESQPQEEEKPSGRGKRSAGKRLSMLTRTAQEGEAILKGMGHKEEATEGRRTTRSSTRGSTGSQATPPPAKRERKTPSTGKGSSRRGRPKKGDEPENEDIEDSKVESKDEGTNVDTENGKIEEDDKKENNVDGTDGAGDSKPMEVEESETPTPAEADKPIDNGPAEQPKEKEHSSEKPEQKSQVQEPEEPEKSEDCTKPETVVVNSESDTREAPPSQSE